MGKHCSYEAITRNDSITTAAATQDVLSEPLQSAAASPEQRPRQEATEPSGLPDASPDGDLDSAQISQPYQALWAQSLYASRPPVPTLGPMNATNSTAINQYPTGSINFELHGHDPYALQNNPVRPGTLSQHCYDLNIDVEAAPASTQYPSLNDAQDTLTSTRYPPSRQQNTSTARRRRPSRHAQDPPASTHYPPLTHVEDLPSSSSYPPLNDDENAEGRCNNQ